MEEGSLMFIMCSPDFTTFSAKISLFFVMILYLTIIYSPVDLTLLFLFLIHPIWDKIVPNLSPPCWIIS